VKIAVIPARGGSKRIPRKNIKDFCGKPMIAYSIEAALQSDCFDKVIVSTDDMEIAEVAKKYGAEVPFMRPVELSDDYAGTNSVVIHALDYYESIGVDISIVSCIYATAPFLSSSKILDAFNIIEKNNDIDYAVTVAKYPFPIQRSLRLLHNGRLELNNTEFAMSRSQDLEEYYHDAGQLYCGRPESFRNQPTAFLGNVLPIFLDSKNIQDIDIQEDWDRAELLFNALYEEKND